MGQQIAALMMGAELTDELNSKITDKRHDGEWIWDIGKPSIDYRKTPKMSEAGDAIGFAYAISGGSERDMATMGDESIPVSQIGKAYPDERAKATEKWRAFAAWLKQHRGVDLPEPEIILTCIEVA